MDQGSLRPLAGGWSGQTYVSESGGERTVVRIYPPDSRRGPAAPEIDAAVLALVRGLVPVPEVLEVRRTNEDVPGLLITSWMDGTPGYLALTRLDEPARARMGADMGRLAGMLAGIPTLAPGMFVDARLSIEPFDASGAAGLEDWVDAHPIRGWTSQESAALRGLAREAQRLLDATRRSCLVHSDLNPKNVLVDARGRVTAVLDWEFAHSGHPMTDLGNVLRIERDPVYADAAVSGYVGLRGGAAHEVVEAARAADLWALVELAGRTHRNPVADRAEALLRDMISAAH